MRHMTTDAKTGKVPNKLGDKFVTLKSMIQTLERAWTENRVPDVLLSPDVVILGKSLKLWSLAPLCTKLGIWI